jgi:hypothetical protein
MLEKLPMSYGAMHLQYIPMVEGADVCAGTYVSCLGTQIE